MPETPGEGGQFAADLYELYEVAQKDLRPLAEQYSGYSAALAQSSAYELDPSPVAGAAFPGGGIFRSGSALLTLRDEVQYAFAKSSENIESAAVTLTQVVENYASTDDETQADFDSLTAEGFTDDGTRRPSSEPVYPEGRSNSGGPIPRD
ncbi:hypothetical protein K3N28_10900 [Glycomyces sp. TRM65418]|uniref:hypothetical protein n=1 Tax=Glycomyces sp. TRM65418 TaxID=2867006 RepID=UPI001CE51913|nr:hypothetical protein [Glycomyces sp. TRM65418]MCC3763580.1 hypothetical protein [Glycomyces sp. TRM65418]QZD57563.1 hypothetical protein K3N28_10840 [Glycomyces sp. TRM65418]